MRREQDKTIEDEGRDRGKVFRLTEMSAIEGDKWANRALLLLARSGVEIGDLRTKSGMLGLFAAGIRSLPLVSHQEIEPLLDELTGKCIEIVPPNKIARKLIWSSGPKGDSDIEEVATLWTLRHALLDLHLGFSVAEVLSSGSTSATASQEPSSVQTSETP